MPALGAGGRGFDSLLPYTIYNSLTKRTRHLLDIRARYLFTKRLEKKGLLKTGAIGYERGYKKKNAKEKFKCSGCHWKA